ncbi:hypothetical protein PISMIDRAFT_673896 [Pisolithus microcarpus 441]|uniref:Uncharacterized protein n=1 Tax=Pisolithus microcarpus 441 TaxID=765257 RepID=A0A0C9ZQ34_9AGAM|nr:hypothetical protein PISMIDRAFT_673896 [Pisolithus microcarpus 441]
MIPLEEMEGGRLDLTTTTKAFGNDDCITCADVTPAHLPSQYSSDPANLRARRSVSECRRMTYIIRHDADSFAVAVHEEDNDPGESQLEI